MHITVVKLCSPSLSIVIHFLSVFSLSVVSWASGNLPQRSNLQHEQPTERLSYDLNATVSKFFNSSAHALFGAHIQFGYFAIDRKLRGPRDPADSRVICLQQSNRNQNK